MEFIIYILLEKKENKTWSLVSNSSLSKTFARCQFKKLRVQKLCFLPPKIVLGLKKSESINYFGSEKNVGPEKNLGPKKFWIRKKFGSGINLAPKKNLGPKKILGLKKFWFKIFYCSCSCSSYDMDPHPPKLSQKPMSSLCVKFQPSSTPLLIDFGEGFLLFFL